MKNVPKPSIVLGQAIEENRNKDGVITTQQQKITQIAADDTPGNIVQVLPFDTKTTTINRSKLQRLSSFKGGLLAWGDMVTAQNNCDVFDAVIVTAEEFDFHNQDFASRAFVTTSRCRDGIYFVPISEIGSYGAKDFILNKNKLLQPVMQVGRLRKTDMMKAALLRPDQQRTGTVSSPQLIFKLLDEGKRVLVVCMAGRNRSTSTLLLFLMLLPFLPRTKSTILTTPREKQWTLTKWHSYLQHKRQTKVFQLNNAQLESINTVLELLNDTQKLTF